MNAVPKLEGFARKLREAEGALRPCRCCLFFSTELLWQSVSSRQQRRARICRQTFTRRCCC